MLKVKYVRVSTDGQNTDRQKSNTQKFDKVYEEHISGSVPMEKRTEGAKLLSDIKSGTISDLYVASIDRMGRDTIDVLHTIRLCEEHSVNVVVEDFGLHSLDGNGKPNMMFKLVSGIVATLAENERRTIAARCTAGRTIARLKGVKFGRRVGDKENRADFMKKEKVQLVMKTIKKRPSLTVRELASINNCSVNLILKVRGMM